MEKVYILTLRDNDEIHKIIRNLGVFSRRSLGMAYMIQHIADLKLGAGHFHFGTVEELIDREQEIDFNPQSLEIFNNDFFSIVAEVSTLV